MIICQISDFVGKFCRWASKIDHQGRQLREEFLVLFILCHRRSSADIGGAEVMRELAGGAGAQCALEAVIGADAGVAARQLVVLDAAGNSAGWTGASNVSVSEHDLMSDMAAAGNWLANDLVLPALKRAFFATRGAMAVRLLSALEAGATAGGDARGVRSAALQVVSVERPPLDLRVDYSKTPIGDLKSLYAMTQDEEYQKFLAQLPTLSQPQRW